MSPNIISAIIAATGAVVKASIEAYQNTKIAKSNRRAPIAVASLEVLGAAITATHKAIEVYRLSRRQLRKG